MKPQLVDAVLPAGGRLEGAFAEEAGTAVKALIRINGRTVLERTIETLRESGCVGRIVVVGPAELALHPATRNADAVLEEGDSGPENIMRGLECLRGAGEEARRVLILTTDLPFLTGAALESFLAACPNDADVCVPVIREDDFHARFAESPATFVRLRDGAWAIGCGFLVNPDAIRRNIDSVLRVFHARKSEVAMARLLGPAFVFGYLTRRLGVDRIQDRCSEIIGCSGAAVRGCPPELAADIDTLDEFRYAVAISGFQHELANSL